ncbi:hypothetical protein OCAR_4556 [Afipia carboxidovorans OM5]|nr:hypothetical protein OCAR_4556 [Afipia carboxidovorans OM5]
MVWAFYCLLFPSGPSAANRYNPGNRDCRLCDNLSGMRLKHLTLSQALCSIKDGLRYMSGS